MSTESRPPYHEFDEDALDLVTSRAATQVTRLMAAVYLRLVVAPQRFWLNDQNGPELHFRGELRGDKMLTGWDQLLAYLRVSDNTARKALKWLDGQGVIAYQRSPRAEGIRIRLKGAVSSNGKRPSTVAS